MADPVKRDHDAAVAELSHLLINFVVASSADEPTGKTPRDKLLNYVKSRTDERVMLALDAFSAYRSAQAAERQATAMETVAKAISAQAMAEKVDTDAAAMVDLREPKREYLATTYSLTTGELSILWAIRGILMDGAVKSLSKPDRFDPYRRVTTEEIAWSLRISPEMLWSLLPRNADGTVNYFVLEDFDIMHYGGTDDQPEDWMFGG